MSRNTWQIERKIAGIWTDEGQTIYRPNEELPREIMTTMTKMPLADGSNAYTTFTTKYIQQPLNLSWMEVDWDYVTQINNYVINGYDIKITDHLGNSYPGRFTSSSPVELLKEDAFDLFVIFEVIPSLA